MKQIFYFLIASVLFTSCVKDNYQAPDAVIYGSFIDSATNELVEQDIVQGTQIEYIEKGYTAIQYLVVKNDGTYRNSMMFSGEYSFSPVRGNFHAITSQDVKIAGETKLDFYVTPYLRIKGLTISQDNNLVEAKFKVEQTDNNNVQRVGLFASDESAVGSVINLKMVEIPVGSTISPDSTISIKMDISDGVLKPGQSYYFRAGAISSAAEAKYNYAPAVVISLK